MIKQHLFSLCLICFCIFTLFSCKNDQEAVAIGMIPATIVFSDTNADHVNCGWIIVQGGVPYKAQNLEELFQIDGLAVRINYSIQAPEPTCENNTLIDWIILNRIEVE